MLLVEGFREGTKTPVDPIGSKRRRIVTHIKIAQDGAASGSVEVFENGRDAAQTRAAMRRLGKDVEQDLVKDVLRRQGMIGSGQFVKDNPDGLKDSYHYKATFNAEKFLKVSGAGAFYVYPPLGLSRTIASYLRSSVDEPEKDADVTCEGVYAEEEYAIELPKAVRILSVPDDLKVGNGTVSYRATYKLKGHVLTVKRVLDDRTPGNVCSPKTMAAYKTIADKAMDNLKEQVLYK